VDFLDEANFDSYDID
jgi:hypothetical protein